jgi:oligopeptide transport system permease protein
LKNLRERYHLDEGLGAQLLRYLGDLTRGDLGPSLRFSDFSVNDLVAIGLPKTLLVGACAMAFALAVGIPLGAAAALRRGKPIDRLAGAVSVAGLAVPNFVLGPLLVAAFAAGLGWLEPGGLDRPADLVLPAVALGFGPLAVVTRLTRAGLLEVLSQDFIRTARAKGLPERVILTRHALRGGLGPVVTYLGPALAAVLTGSLVVESTFSIPGIGRYLVNGAFNRDYPLVLGIVLLGTSALVVANILVDALYWVLDPRVRAS